MNEIMINGVGLNEMALAYTRAALFTSDVELEIDEPSDMMLHPHDIAAATLQEIADDCELFCYENEMIIEHALAARPDKDMSDIGHDFWMTRCDHGVGFWEKGDWPDKEGRLLTEAAKLFGQYHLFISENGDRKIYGEKG